MDALQSYSHMIFDANCYFDYVKWLVALYKTAPSLCAVVSPYFSRDMAVFLYEAFALVGKDGIISNGDETMHDFYVDLEIMRNNIHQLVTRDKKFADESERITVSTEQLQSVFKTNADGLVSLFAKDIGLTRAKTAEGDLWIASTLFPWFLLDRTSMVDKDGPIGEKVKAHSTLMSATIKAIVEKLNEHTDDAFVASLSLPLRNINESALYHEDITLSKIEKKTGFPLELTYTLLLIADEIGEHLFLTNYVLDKSLAFQDDVTLFFLTKLLAIRYDEVFDTLWKFRNRSDYKSDATDRLDIELHQRGVLPQKETLRDFAKALRNSIHYKDTPWCPTVSNGKIDYIPAFLHLISGGDWPSTYLVYYSDMESQLRSLYTYLMEFFDIKGTYVEM